MENLKIQKLFNDARLPEKPRQGDIGIDLYSHRVIEQTEEKIVYGCGICIELPEGYYSLIYPRSSIVKKDLMLFNSVGVIDNSYRGELILVFKKLKRDNPRVYLEKEKIAQLIIQKEVMFNILETTKLSNTIRGTDGFGSTGLT